MCMGRAVVVMWARTASSLVLAISASLAELVSERCSWAVEMLYGGSVAGEDAEMRVVAVAGAVETCGKGSLV